MRTIVGLFDSWPEAESAITELEASGFSRGDIGLIAPSNTVGSASGAGTAIGAGLGLLAGLSMIAVPGIGALAALGQTPVSAHTMNNEPDPSGNTTMGDAASAMPTGHRATNWGES